MKIPAPLGQFILQARHQGKRYKQGFWFEKSTQKTLLAAAGPAEHMGLVTFNTLKANLEK